MKQLFFWLVAIITIFSLCRPLKNNFLTEFAVKRFERWMESDEIRAIFDLDEEEAISVFGQTAEEVYL